MRDGRHCFSKTAGRDPEKHVRGSDDVLKQNKPIWIKNGERSNTLIMPCSFWFAYIYESAEERVDGLDCFTTFVRDQR